VLSPEVDIVVFLLYARLSPRVRFLAAAATVVAATAAVIVLKATVGRPLPTRPSHFYGGYPSGHTAAILVCAGAAIILSDLDERRRRQCWVATAAATTLVAVSLLYIEVHWLSDILASIALAAAVLWVVAVTHSPHVMSRSPDPAPPPDHS
jgi:undecaprenyl-diphosphatase